MERLGMQMDAATFEHPGIRPKRSCEMADAEGD